LKKTPKNVKKTA